MAICLSAFMSACEQSAGGIDDLEDECETVNSHLEGLVSSLKKVNQTETVSSDKSSVTFDFSVSDSTIVQVVQAGSSWKFTALKAGTTLVTLVRKASCSPEGQSFTGTITITD